MIYFQYKARQVLVGHSAPVTALEAMYVCADNEEMGKGKQLLKTVIISASVDSTVKIWTRFPDQGLIYNLFHEFKVDRLIMTTFYINISDFD